MRFLRGAKNLDLGKVMLTASRRKLNFYIAVASIILSKDPAAVSEEERLHAKRSVYWYGYGGANEFA